MIARLLLALLVLMTAPATAARPACHDAPAVMTGMAHHDPVPAKGMPADPCIGCIAPATIHPPALAARVRVALPAPVAPARTALAGTRVPPATPPPRRG